MRAADSFQKKPSYFRLSIKFRLGHPKLVLRLQNTTVEPPQNKGTAAMVNIPNISTPTHYPEEAFQPVFCILLMEHHLKKNLQ